jgi:hypothetical protein
MILPEHHHVIEQFPTDTTHEAPAIPFCQGLRKAVRLGPIPSRSIERPTSGEKIASLSSIR